MPHNRTASPKPHRISRRERHLLGLLERSEQALSDWVTTYAREMCDDVHVAAARDRIMGGGGTLAYAAALTDDIRKALQNG